MTFNLYGPKPAPSVDPYGPDDFLLQPITTLNTGNPQVVGSNREGGNTIGAGVTQFQFKPDGSFIAYWQSGRDLVAQLYSRTGVATGQQITLNTPASADPAVVIGGYQRSQPTIDFAADGSFVAAYTVFGKDTVAEGIYFRRFTANGVAKDLVERPGNPGVQEFYQNSAGNQLSYGGFQDRPNIIVSADGSFIITYHVRQFQSVFDQQLMTFVPVTILSGVRFNADGQRLNADGTLAIVDPADPATTDPSRVIINLASPVGITIDPVRQPGDPAPPAPPPPRTASLIGETVVQKLPGGQFVIRYEVLSAIERIGYAFAVFKADGSQPDFAPAPPNRQDAVDNQNVLRFIFFTGPAPNDVARLRARPHSRVCRESESYPVPRLRRHASVCYALDQLEQRRYFRQPALQHHRRRPGGLGGVPDDAHPDRGHGAPHAQLRQPLYRRFHRYQSAHDHDAEQYRARARDCRWSERASDVHAVSGCEQRQE